MNQGGLYAGLRRQWRAVLLVGLALPLAGVWLGGRMPAAIFPSVHFPRLVISIDAGEMPQARMLVEVTRPVEEALRGLPGVLIVKSTTSRGGAEVSANFNWHVDMRATYLLAQTALGEARGRLPAGIEISVRQMDQTLFPVAGLTLTSPRLPAEALTDYAEQQLRPLLAAIPGVARVTIEGGRRREFLITVDPRKLAQRRLTLESLEQAIARSADIRSPGRFSADGQLYLAIVSGEAAAGVPLSDITISEGAQPVKLGEVATVSDAAAPIFTATTANGQPALMVDVFRQPDADTRRVVNELRTRLAVPGAIPPSVTVGWYYDQSDLVASSYRSVLDSMGVGMVMAALIVFLFLGDWRLAGIAVVIVPLTLLATTGILGLLGESLNIMTLGGLAAGVGLIVDDAIVMVEALAAQQTQAVEGVSRGLAGAFRRITPALAGSSIASVLVHVPLAFLDGVAGAFFKSLSLTVAVALTISFLYAWFFLPALLSARARPPGADVGRLAARMARLWNGVEDRYGRGLAWLLGRRRTLAVICLTMAVATVLLYGRLETGFLPEMDEGGFVLDYKLPPGMSLEASGKILARVEATVRDIPEVAHYARRTGIQTGGWLTEINRGDIAIRLKPQRQRGGEAVIEELRHRLQREMPGLQTEFFQLMEDMVGDLTSVPQPVEVKIFSENPLDGRDTARRIAERLEKIPGLADVTNGQIASGPTLGLVLRPEPAGRTTIGQERLALNLNALLEGEPVAKLLKGERLTTLRLRLAPAPGHLDEVNALPLLGDGGVVPLGEVSRTGVDANSLEINRENLRTVYAPTARLEGVDLGTAIQRVKTVLRDFPPQPGMRIELGGIYAEQQASFKALLGVLAGAVLLVFLTLLIQFKSWRDACVVILTAGLSVAGVFLALLVTRTPLNLALMVGMVMIIGIVAENSIFVLQTYHHERAEGVAVRQSLVNAGRERLRPVLMTTLAGILALAPLALGLGAGAEMLRPLAIAVIGGFCVSALLALFLLPGLIAATRKEDPVAVPAPAR